MDGDSALVKIDSAAAKALVEKAAEGIGGAFRPWQIKRVAKAEAEAEIIRAQAQIEIDELQRRAVTRFVAEEAKKQDNMENIIRNAIPLLSESSHPQEMGNDWVANFFDKCRIISDDEMQMLWAKVLAGEANSPGSFSKRTVNSLASLDKTDAQSFTSLCRFGWEIEELYPLIFDADDSIYGAGGIHFEALVHLDAIGLISFGQATFTKGRLPRLIVAKYYGTPVTIQFKRPDNNELVVGHALLTRIGLELARICGAQPVDGFLDYAIQQWRKEGLTVSSSLEANT